MNLEEKSIQFSPESEKTWLIMKYWTEEMSLSEIALVLGVTPQTVFRKMNLYNITRRTISEANKCKHKNNPISKKQKEFLKTLGKNKKIIIPKEILFDLYWNQNKATTEIGKIFSCSSVTVISRMKENNIKLRTPSERKSGSNNPIWGMTGSKSPRWGKQHTEKTKKILSQKNSGKNSPRWISPEKRKETFYSQIRATTNMKKWRFSVYKRDNFTCVMCNKKRSKNTKINADHIKPFSIIVLENNISTIREAVSCKELWDINNGRTLCIDCHKNTDTFGWKMQKILKEKGTNCG